MSSQNTIFLLRHARFHSVQVFKKLMSLHLPITSLKREARLSPQQLSNLIFVVHVLSPWVPIGRVLLSGNLGPQDMSFLLGPPHSPDQWFLPGQNSHKLPGGQGPEDCSPFLRLKVGVPHFRGRALLRFGATREWETHG